MVIVDVREQSSLAIDENFEEVTFMITFDEQIVFHLCKKRQQIVLMK